MNVFVIGKAGVRFRDRVFQGDHASCACIRVVKSGEPKHGRDMGLIFRLNLLHVGAVAQIVLAVGQLDATLQQIRMVMLGIVKARSDPQTK